jgi:magnesium chelatase family protein
MSKWTCTRPGGNARDFITVGMPDTTVRESRERIKSALINSGFGYPNKSVTINLAPANVRKEGAGFDLPRRQGIPNLLLPADNAAETAVAEGVNVFGMRHLADIVIYLNQPDQLRPANNGAPGTVPIDSAFPDFRDVRGQTTAKRTLEVAAGEDTTS